MITDPTDAFQAAASPEEEQAIAVADALIKLQRAFPPERGECVPPENLAAFAGGGLDPEQCAEIMVHLTSCGPCRTQERIFRASAGVRPGRLFHLPSLRRAALQGAGAASAAAELRDTRDWLARLLRSSTALDADGLMNTLLLVAPGAAGGPGAHATVRHLAYPALDYAGRLTMELEQASGSALSYVIVAVQDQECRLELAALPFVDRTLDAVVDCGFLNLEPGMIPQGAVNLEPVGVDAAGRWWESPPLLDALDRLAASCLTPLEMFDAFASLVSGAGSDWAAGLRVEMGSAADAERCEAVLRSVLGALNRFSRTWRQSNGQDHPAAVAYVAALTEILQITHRPRRAADTSRDATVYPRKSGKKAREAQAEEK